MTNSAPALKGAAVHRTIDLLKEAIEAGQISMDDVTVRLEASDLNLLDEKIESSLWYPVDSVSRISELLLETLGKNDYDFMVDQGRETAARFQREGIFAAFIQDAAKRGDRMGPTLVEISELALNFGDWSFEGESMQDFTITVRDALQLPETMRYSILGFIETLASDLAGVQMEASTSREDASVVVYRCLAVKP